MEELYGLELVAGLRRRLKRGTVYVTLNRMEEKGYVTSRLQDAPPGAGGSPPRLYEATTLGRRMLSVWTSGARCLASRAWRVSSRPWPLDSADGGPSVR